jgi:PAS domain S-box-containing protein
METEEAAPTGFLVVDDDPDDRALVRRVLAKDFPGASVREAGDEAGLAAALAEGPYDVVITDFHLPWTDGLAVLKRARERMPDGVVIMLTGTGNEGVAVEAMKSGLDDYVVKTPQHGMRLSGAVMAAVRRHRMRSAEGEFQRRLLAVLESVSDFAGTASLDRRLLYVNAAGRRMLGLAEGAAVDGMTLQDVYPASAYDRLDRDAFPAALRDGRWTGESAVRRLDGRETPVSLTLIVHRSVAGSPSYVSIVMRDVSEQRQAREELARSDRFLKDLVDHLPVAVFVKDARDGRFVLWNRQAEILFGFSADLVLGKTDHDLFPKEQADHFRATDARVMAGGTLVVVPEEPVDASHGRRWLRTHKAPILDGDGHPGYLLAISEDVTESKTAREALRRSEAYYRALIENISDNITIMDAAGKTLYESPSVERMLGYKPEELVGQDAFETVHPEDLPLVRSLFEDKLRSPDGGAASVRFRCRHKDGTWRTLEAVGHRMAGPDGEPLTVLNSRDVTERRHLEEQLEQSVKMEAVGRLAGGVAHDFNNMLTVILGFSDMLLKRAGSDAELRESAQEIKNAGERASALTRQLLAFSRKQILRPVPLDLNGLVGGVQKMLRRLIGEDVELKAVLSEGLWSVKADAGQVEQVLVNLAVNARDAMPDGGKLTVSTRNQPASSAAALPPEMARGDCVVLTVSDTGVGMSPDVQRLIFEPFFTTKAEGKGTGLGLPTVYGIMKQSGGHVQVESAPGAGATFRLYFPRHDEAAAPSSPRAADASVGGRETVLLVEDEESVRSLARRVLKEKGYRVLEAKNGQEALAVFEKAKGAVDLLLTDVVMPQVGGVELVRRLPAAKSGLRVLFMSGYTDKAVVESGGLDGGVAFLQKPFTPDALSAKVREVLDSPRSQPT